MERLCDAWHDNEKSIVLKVEHEFNDSTIDIPLEKEWLARRDGVTRDSHLLADGQRVNKVANFKVGGYNMRYPADSSQGAPAGEIVNCRCTVIYHEKRRI